MILVDSNVLMYAAGAEHPNKNPSVAWLERVARGDVDATLDAETLQEILYRYRSIRRWEEGRRVFDLARKMFPLVIPIDTEILDLARGILDSYPGLMARDALHASVVVRHELEAICSFDRDFDRIAGLRRLKPA